MSRQAQFQRLGKLVNARESAHRMLHKDVLPALAAQNADMASVEQVHLRELQHCGLVVSLTSPNRNPSDLLFLAAILKWLLDSKLARFPQEIVDQAQELAARTFDYVEVRKVADAERDAALLAADIERERREELEPLAQTGLEVTAQRKKAGITTSKERARELSPTWKAYRDEAERIFEANPRLTRNAIAKKIAAQFGDVRSRTVWTHIEGIGRSWKKD